MIFDVVDNAEQYYFLGPLFQKGFEYIKNTNFSTMQPGRYSIIGDDLYALIKEYDTRTVDECEMETHLEYADIHYIREGFEFIAYADKSRMKDATFTRLVMTDVHLYEKQYNNTLFLEKGDFTVFLRNDAHMPHLRALVGTKVKKVLIKVRVEANEMAKRGDMTQIS